MGQYPIKEPREFCGHPRVGDGEPCKRRPEKGGVVCSVHGGRVPATKRAAADRRNLLEARKKMQQRMAKEGFPTFESAVEEIEKIAAEAIFFKDICRERLEAIGDSWRYDHQHGEQLRAEVALYERAIDRCDKVLSNYVRLGIADRKVKIDEAQALLLVNVIKSILGRLDLTREQKVLAGQVVPEELRAIESKKD